MVCGNNKISEFLKNFISTRNPVGACSFCMCVGLVESACVCGCRNVCRRCQFGCVSLCRGRVCGSFFGGKVRNKRVCRFFLVGRGVWLGGNGF